jgi:hypothetical protein
MQQMILRFFVENNPHKTDADYEASIKHKVLTGNIFILIIEKL